MPTDIQYALMAANAYSVKATVTSEQNAIPVPQGFIPIERRINEQTGFTARAYGNSPEEEIEPGPFDLDHFRKAHADDKASCHRNGRSARADSVKAGYGNDVIFGTGGCDDLFEDPAALAPRSWPRSRRWRDGGKAPADQVWMAAA